jgi:protein translocase SecG subunit
LLTYILYGLFILACVILIVTILLQPGKADAGALFSNTLSSTAFGPRGTASLLAKITIGAAAAFMLIALMLGLPVFTGSRSVLQRRLQRNNRQPHLQHHLRDRRHRRRHPQLHLRRLSSSQTNHLRGVVIRAALR